MTHAQLVRRVTGADRTHARHVGEVNGANVTSSIASVRLPRRATAIWLGAVMAITVLVPLATSPGVTQRAGGATIPICAPAQLQTMVVFNGPGNPDGDITISSNSPRACALSGRPTIRLFTSSRRPLAFTETPYRWSPSLPIPSGPIVMSPNQPWAIVEMRWCGFSPAPRRMALSFRGWQHAQSVGASSFASSFFRPPSCANGSANRIALDVTRKLGPRGIAGRVPVVHVTPASNLHSGETVLVTVRGFDIGAKFFMSECATTADANEDGCGEELAAEPFGVTDVTGSGRITFVVSNRAGTRPYDPSDTVACRQTCVLVATGGLGSSFAMAPLRFVNP